MSGQIFCWCIVCARLHSGLWVAPVFWFTNPYQGYDAIAYYDNDVEIQGDITPVLRCAASGKFLSTNGASFLSANGASALLNLGFFALKPDKRLFQASLTFGGSRWQAVSPDEKCLIKSDWDLPRSTWASIPLILPHPMANSSTLWRSCFQVPHTFWQVSDRVRVSSRWCGVNLGSSHPHYERAHELSHV